MRKFKGELCLLLAALIWGSAFIFQKMGMDHVGPFTFGFFRFTLGSLALLPLIWGYGKINAKRPEPKEITPFRNRVLLLGGLQCGIASFVAGSLQQIGIVYTTAGKAGFITSLDIIIVPILLLFLKRRVGTFTWIGVAIAGFGLYLLCITEGFTIQLGDGLVMACAFCYSLQILLIDYYSDKVDAIKLSFLQFLISGLLSGVFMLFLETVSLQDIIDCAVPILYTAILEVSIAFTLQIIGQKDTPPAIAALIMSLEAFFSAVCGALFLGEVMSGREMLGCALMLTAFIISQIPDKKERAQRRELR
ncbi:DMT family transporter [Anaerovorax odorimutans]|uniref:DMT family transporter n=1 Tax=Anaerovorax odorimutans TaxID=109327 RepID=A0ABT1RLI0_9FIRM|nr:DMT family transporter [Anaerovorax odorimutans]MCQ4636050.1 DMT family transporter [Anaerovorax odorimutans]